MTHIQCIMFDCMETIVDVYEKPDLKMYSSFAYNGCGFEHLWKRFEDFVNEYGNARDILTKAKKQYEEHSTYDRFAYMLKNRFLETIDEEGVLASLSENYWRNYKANCYVDDTVRSILIDLSSTYKCGIVSNFMVPGGIEELLKIYGIDRFFDFVVTSINVGWRKPHEMIYKTALEFADVQKDKVLFVGDDYVCDYLGPQRFGFNSVLLDRSDSYKSDVVKITRLDQLRHLMCPAE